MDFNAGDHIIIKGLTDASASLNGKFGTLKKPVGKDKWAVIVDGEERSKVICTKYLEHTSVTDNMDLRISIVGTWDDWEAHDMKWNAAEKRFECSIELIHEQESFKFLVDEDWDFLICPDKPNASPYIEHIILAPDDESSAENAELEWTIGLHQEDKAQQGDTCEIYLYVDSDGTPQRVSWELYGDDSKQSFSPPDRAPKPTSKEAEPDVPTSKKPDPDVPTIKEAEPDVYPAKKSASHGRPWDVESSTKTAARGIQKEAEVRPLPVVRRSQDADEESDPEVLPVVSGGLRRHAGLFSIYQREQEQKFRSLEDREEEQEMLRQEAAARERLEDRLREAAEKEKLAIMDAAEQDLLIERREEQAQEMQKTKIKPTSDWTGFRGVCVECKKKVHIPLMTNGSCKDCWSEYQQLLKDGWHAEILCDGVCAAELAIQFRQQGIRTLTKNEARRKVLERYPLCFATQQDVTPAVAAQ